MTLSNYNHEWRDKNKFPDGCADLFWWLEYWKEIHAKNLERFKIPETKNWNFLIANLLRETSRENSFIEELKGPPYSGTENYLTNEIIEIIRTVAQNLKPYESCKGLLVDRTEKLIEENKQILANGPY